MFQGERVASLSDYLAEVERYLHDSTNSYWSESDLTAYINKAIKQRDRDTGMNREITTFTLTTGTNVYQVASVNANAFDVFSIILNYSNVRQLLSQLPYTLLTSQVQGINLYNQVSLAYAKYGAGAIYFAPAPNQAYVTEWDCLVASPDLVNATDADPLPAPWTDPVPFLACSFAKIQIQQYDEAERFKGLYRDRLDEVMANSRSSSMPYPYYGFSGWR